ncbi:MAG TPA: DUF4124 domain-containing protein [Rudaea sp.]
MRAALFAIVPVLLWTSCAAAGEIYRCTSARGEVMYTNIACPPNSAVRHVASYTPEPPSPPESADEAAARRSAANAQQAAAAAQQASAAARQAQVAAEQVREIKNEPVPANDEAADFLPVYPIGYGGRGFGHRFPHRTAGTPGHHHPMHAITRAPMFAPAPHR